MGQRCNCERELVLETRAKGKTDDTRVYTFCSNSGTYREVLIRLGGGHPLSAAMIGKGNLAWERKLRKAFADRGERGRSFINLQEYLMRGPLHLI